MHSVVAAVNRAVSARKETELQNIANTAIIQTMRPPQCFFVMESIRTLTIICRSIEPSSENCFANAVARLEAFDVKRATDGFSCVIGCTEACQSEGAWSIVPEKQQPVAGRQQTSNIK